MKRLFYTLLMLFCTGPVFLLQAQDFDWAQVYGGAGTQATINASGVDSAGNYYSAGILHGVVDMDPGPATFNLGVFMDTRPFVQCMDTAGNLLWAFDMPIESMTFWGMEIDASGNIYLVGNFYGTHDFDVGPGILNLSSYTSGFLITGDVFVMKLDASRNLLWAFNIGNIENEEVIHTALDPDCNLYISGPLRGTSPLDLDPGSSALELSADTSATDCYVAKYDSAGNLLGAFSLSVTGVGSYAEAFLRTDAYGNLVLSGQVVGTGFDLDPGPGVLPPSSPDHNAFVCKLDTSLGMLWAHSYGSTGTEYAGSIVMDGLGNIFVTGEYSGTVDFDPGPGTLLLTASDTSDGFLAKLDSGGSLLWAYSIEGVGRAIPRDLKLDEMGGVYLVGCFEGSVDLDLGVGTQTHTSSGGAPTAGFMAKYNTDGQLIWSMGMEGDHSDVYTVSILPSRSLFFRGLSAGYNDLDPTVSGSLFMTSSSLFYDCFILKLRQGNCSSFAISLDSLDRITCGLPVGYASASPIGGLPPFDWEWSTIPPTLASAAALPTEGLYSVSLTDDAGCATTRSIWMDAPSSFSGYDLRAHLHASTMVPGFLSTLWLDGMNDGCVAVSGQIKLVPDPRVSVEASSPPPSFVLGDTLIWSFVDLTYDSAHLEPVLQLRIDTSATVGDTLWFNLSINPMIGDDVLGNNEQEYYHILQGAIDPNDIQVLPQGECEEHFVGLTQPLTYTIRFQNVGTAPAVNVVICDTLDAHLDMASFSVKSTSHPMYTEVLPGNVLQFMFDNILLPDSTSDESGSHGFVIFEIQPVASIPSGTLVGNEASIRFDFAPPIVTNRVSVTFVDPIPPCVIDAIFIGHENAPLTLYPNPAGGRVCVLSASPLDGAISIYSLSGRMLKKVDVHQQQEVWIDLQGLLPGLYFLKVESASESSSFKLEVR